MLLESIFFNIFILSIVILRVRSSNFLLFHDTIDTAENVKKKLFCPVNNNFLLTKLLFEVWMLIRVIVPGYISIGLGFLFVLTVLVYQVGIVIGTFQYNFVMY